MGRIAVARRVTEDKDREMGDMVVYVQMLF